MSALTYVYGVLARARPPRLGRCPEGPPAASAPRALPAARGLWLVVATVPGARYSAAAIERRLGDLDWVAACAAGHDRVLGHLQRQGAVVPMRLFTLFRDDDRALAHVAAEARRIRRVVARLDGRAEWSVRAVFDERAVTVPGPSGAGPRSGTEFLLARKVARDARRTAAARAQAAAERLYSSLARRADGASRRPGLAAAEAGRHLLLDASFLVPTAARAEFRRAAREAARLGRAAALDVRVSGPWPPYSFVGGRR